MEKDWNWIDLAKCILLCMSSILFVSKGFEGYQPLVGTLAIGILASIVREEEEE